MTALLHDVPRRGRSSRRGGGRDGGLQKQLIGPVPPPLRRRMAGRLPANPPLLPLHDPLRKDETLSEWRRQHWAAHGQLRAAPRAAHEPAGLVGSGRICLLRTDHLGDVEANRCSLSHGRLLWWSVNTSTLALKCCRGASTPSTPLRALDTGLPDWLPAQLRGSDPQITAMSQQAVVCIPHDPFAAGAATTAPSGRRMPMSSRELLLAATALLFVAPALAQQQPQSQQQNRSQSTQQGERN